MAGSIIKIAAKSLAKKSLRSKSKKKQAKEGMGTSSKYRVDSATRAKRASGVVGQLRSDEQKLINLKDASKKATNSEDKAALAEEIKILTNKIDNMKKRFNLKSKGGSMKKYEKGGKISKPISKKEAFAQHRRSTGRYHMADPLHPMNAERVSKMEPIKPRNKSLARRKSGGKIGKCSHNRLY